MVKGEFPTQHSLAASGSDAKGGYEIHLSLGTIQGESSSSAHPNEIELDSFSWGVTNSPVNTQNGTIKGGKVSVTEVTVTKPLDKSSIQLLKASTTGQVLPKATITWSKATGGKKPEDFITITLQGVLVSSVQQSSAHSLAGMGMETITLSFDQVSVDYKVQGKDGLLTSAGSMGYNLAQGKATS